jgi:hypothetical protein
MVDVASPRRCDNLGDATQLSERVFIILADWIIWDHSRYLKLSELIRSKFKGLVFNYSSFINISF